MAAAGRAKFPLQLRLSGAACEAITSAACRLGRGPASRRVLSLLDRRVPPDPTPINGVSTSDHVVDPARNLSVRLFSLQQQQCDRAPFPTVVYFHGGGFVQGSPFSRQFDGFCRRLSRGIPARVVSVGYRLAPEHKCPAAYDDGVDVLAWLDRGSLPDIGPGEVFIAGDSAGGNIAHHVTRRAMTSSYGRLTVAGLVAIEPFFGGEEDTESERRLEGVPFGSREKHKWYWRAYLPEGAGLDHEAANVFGPGSGAGREDWTRFPPTMVAVGGWDMLQDRDRWYYEGLKKAGVPVSLADYPDATHAFYVFAKLPESAQIVDDVADFVRKWSRRSGGTSRK